ncbi:TPA: helix-turn-helix transcriptional regulator [Clostridioides difficile]|uniref:Helix-turn-helix transcriptional regulator n=1 Tax=Clostridioides difficile TaxID=1496 RepID=A0AAN5VKT0_CLODI|nr:helix-turn-helix transcriptional regulator [Clostridioides difficile]MCC0669258.1 helix-turn-helix transcriptional regulator [Clostridioides sp. ZZV14-6153]MCC0726429.1 helix-turn-helix transcriptional regulator [Clostridioides sp. ZZV14-6045]MCC0731291.1 helix-turn-helix transcriptional regulator [Clostridioides sp. ZZV14-6048]MCC0739906.1 helix-turn-helix transcriptional regulator [Clostridioides sp. ZZV14-5902]MDC0804241.1 helix-turn-helix transcriptional regulator [Clostridium paraputri
MNLDRLKELRESRGYTQQMLSTYINMSTSTYNDKEKGKTSFKIEELEKIAKLLKFTKEEIFELLDLD